MRRHLLPLLSVAVLSICCQPAGAAPTAPKTIRIGALNMYWLGCRWRRWPKGHDRLGPAKNLTKVADYISSAKVDVLAISEVYANAPADESYQLDKIRDLLTANSQAAWKYKLFPRYGEDEQCVGVMWNNERVRLTDVDAIGLERKPKDWVAYAKKHRVLSYEGKLMKSIHTRSVVGARFKVAGEGMTDFIVIPLHLKSNSGDDAGHMPVRRYYEARTLLDSLEKPLLKKRKECDVVLIGDFNTKPSRAERFTPEGSTEPTSAPDYLTSWGEPAFFRVLGGDGQNTHLDRKNGNAFAPAGKHAPFDRAYVPKDQPEFAGSTFAAHYPDSIAGNEREHVEEVSDHLLIYFDMAVGKDDDPH